MKRYREREKKPGNLASSDGMVHARWRVNDDHTVCWACSPWEMHGTLCVNGALERSDEPVNCLVCLANMLVI